jgi:hypothetical protein
MGFPMGVTGASLFQAYIVPEGQSERSLSVANTANASVNRGD